MNVAGLSAALGVEHKGNRGSRFGNFGEFHEHDVVAAGFRG
jgi:hypothetical protein